MSGGDGALDCTLDWEFFEGEGCDVLNLRKPFDLSLCANEYGLVYALYGRPFAFVYSDMWSLSPSDVDVPLALPPFQRYLQRSQGVF